MSQFRITTVSLFLLSVSALVLLPTRIAALNCSFPNLLEAAEYSEAVVKVKVISKDIEKEKYEFEVLKSWKSKQVSERFSMGFDTMWAAYLKENTVYLLAPYPNLSLFGCEDVIPEYEARFKQTEEALDKNYSFVDARTKQIDNIFYSIVPPATLVVSLATFVAVFYRLGKKKK